MQTEKSSQAGSGVKVGDVLAGKYRVEDVLGVGGMGVVVAALHIDLDERVAIKFLLPSVVQDAVAVARFAREARALVKIKNEHVTRVMDVGTLANGAPYMVMEHLTGADLASVFDDRGRLPVDEVCEYILQACEAVAEAHALGIIHRDLKPDNLFLARQPDGTDAIKVLDFGISKMSDLSAESGMELTSTLSVMGTPHYMSPEQMASSRDVDVRTDIWALGAILYLLTTGKPPFDAETLPQFCTLIMREPPPPMATLRANLPPGFEAVVMRCLQKRRKDRYPNVGELALDLLPFAPRRARLSVERIARVLKSTGTGVITVPPSLLPPPRTDAFAEDLPTTLHIPTPAGGSSQQRDSDHRARAVLIGVTVVAVLLGLGLLIWSPGDESPDEAPVLVVNPDAPPAAAAPQEQAATAPAAAPAPPEPAPQAVAAEPTAAPEPAGAAPPAPKPTTKAIPGARNTRRVARSAPRHPRPKKNLANPYRSSKPSKPRPKALDDDIYGSRK